MKILSKEVNELDLTAVQNRLLRKYEISECDARRATYVLRAFLDLKRRDLDAHLILPQIADWAWHELILDTVFYRDVCQRLFGEFLHHMNHLIEFEHTSPDRNQEKVRRAAVLRSDYSITRGLLEQYCEHALSSWGAHWEESGWDAPAYRLRPSFRLDYAIDTVSPAQRIESSEWTSRATAAASFVLTSLDWLSGRLVRRYSISVELAESAVVHYAALFLNVRRDMLSLKICDGPARAAWQEHILWTRRYSNDCDLVIGTFVDHTPNERQKANFTSSIAKAAETPTMAV